MVFGFFFFSFFWFLWLISISFTFKRKFFFLFLSQCQALCLETRRISSVTKQCLTSMHNHWFSIKRSINVCLVLFRKLTPLHCTLYSSYLCSCSETLHLRDVALTTRETANRYMERASIVVAIASSISSVFCRFRSYATTTKVWQELHPSGLSNHARV